MFNKEAIEQLQTGSGIDQASDATRLALAGDFAVSLPKDFVVHDLESFMQKRRRSRGVMETSSIDSFASYVRANKIPGTTVFVSHKTMAANAVLNIGTPDAPGHADDRAQFKPRMTAAYLALSKVSGGQALEQKQVAEFLEDWSHCIDCFNDVEKLTPSKAISAVRNITIEGLRKVEASEQQLNASKSVLEQVTASSKDTLPTTIYFKCVPYHEFEDRVFVMRLGIRTTDKPAITLRVINQEQHDEDMAEELRVKVSNAIVEGVPVLVGDYSAK